MHLLIDGYNLIHTNRTLLQLNPIQLQQERERLIDQLSLYRQHRPCEMTVVFDGWQGGWVSENREKKKGVEVVFSPKGVKADEVIKRIIRERGAGTIVITSDREISKYAERLSVAVIPSGQFQVKMGKENVQMEKDMGEEDEERGLKKKGPSRRPSKKEKRLKLALKKL